MLGCSRNAFSNYTDQFVNKRKWMLLGTFVKLLYLYIFCWTRFLYWRVSIWTSCWNLSNSWKITLMFSMKIKSYAIFKSYPFKISSCRACSSWKQQKNTKNRKQQLFNRFYYIYYSAVKTVLNRKTKQNKQTNEKKVCLRENNWARHQP